jgi:hypothetical protein
VFYATAISIVFNQETFLIQFQFSAETEKETLYLVVSANGAKTLQQTLEEKISEYESQFKAKVEPWRKTSLNRTTMASTLRNFPIFIFS